MKMKTYVRYAVAAAAAGLGIFLFYLSAVSWGQLLLAKDQVMFYLEQPLSVQAAEEAAEKSQEEKQMGGEQEDGTETMPEFCIWGQKDEVEITNDNLCRSAQADAVMMCGSPELLFEDCRLPGRKDTQGCLLDAKTAWDLFGSSEVTGKEITYEGKRYIIRKVLPGNERIFAYQVSSPQGNGDLQGRQPENEAVGGEQNHGGEQDYGGDSVLNRITMHKPEEKSIQDLQALWGNKYGISVTILDLQLLRGIGGFCVLLVPLTSCIYFLWYLFCQYREQSQLVWKAAVAALGLMLAVCFFILLKNQINIPDDYIPTRWSEFSFWQNLWLQKQEAVKLLIKMPKTNVDYSWVAAFVRTLGCGISAEILLLFGIAYIRFYVCKRQK